MLHETSQAQEEKYCIISLMCGIQNKLKLGMAAQTCNPSYSGGGDWEDCSSRQAQVNSSQDPSSNSKS
jgi:hypothetical protein